MSTLPSWITRDFSALDSQPKVNLASTSPSPADEKSFDALEQHLPSQNDQEDCHKSSSFWQKFLCCFKGQHKLHTQHEHQETSLLGEEE